MARVPNRGSPPAILLRESYREGGKVKNRTLANLSHWPEHKVEHAVRAGAEGPAAEGGSGRSVRDHPQPAARACGRRVQQRRALRLAELIDPAPSRRRDLVCAVVVAAVIAPDSKLATARGLRTETATSSLGEVLGVSAVIEDDLYAAMDWALARQGRVENALAARHLANGTLVLYDVSSAAFEGRTCPLGAIGHARDGVKGRRQIVYGLLCSTAGVPVAIEVFEGNTADPKTLARQITKLKTRFGLQRVCLVGDRGMLTNARIRDKSCVRPNWIGSAPCGPRRSRPWSKMARCSCRCSTSRTSSRSTPRTFPGSGWCAAATRYWPRTAPAHAESCSPRRERTGQDRRGHPSRAPAVARARQDRPAGGQGHRPLQHGQALHHRDHRRGVHVHPQHRDHRPEAALDGIYVLRTSLPADTLTDDDVVLRYKGLEDVERFFRTLNSELDVRPIRHRLADRVRAHMSCDAVLLHQLAHETSTSPNPVPRQRQTRRSRQTRQPRRRSPTLRPGTGQPRANAPKTASRYTAHQPARRPGHHLR